MGDDVAVPDVSLSKSFCCSKCVCGWLSLFFDDILCVSLSFVDTSFFWFSIFDSSS